MAKHPYASGNYRPMHCERGLTTCEWQGHIPDELAGGMYIRNGSNPSIASGSSVKTEDFERAYHWFDGDGMLQGVYFPRRPAVDAANDPSGSAVAAPEFVNRYVLTDVLLATPADATTPILPSITTLLGPLRQLPAVIASVSRAVILAALSFAAASAQAISHVSVANTSILYHDGRALAGCESGPLAWVRLPALETVGWWDLDGDDGEIGMREKHGALGWMKEWTTAHPKRDPVTGELILFHSTMLPPYLSYSVIPSTQNGKARTPRILGAPVPISGPRMMHDCAASHTHTILLDIPLSLDPLNLLRGVPIVAYSPTIPARFGVLPRHSPENVRWYSAPSCIIFHTAFAYNQVDPVTRQESLNLVCCRLNSSRLVYAAGNIPTPSSQLQPGMEETCRLYYYSFALSDVVSPQDLTPSHAFALSVLPFEFATVPLEHSMSSSRYVYGCSMRLGSFSAALGGAAKIDCIVKMDVQALVSEGTDRRLHDEQAVDERTMTQILEDQRRGVSSHIKVFAMPPGHFAQESSFVSRASPRGEDDGFLLFYVFDESQLDPLTGEPMAHAKSELWIIDAYTMLDVIAKVQLPQREREIAHQRQAPILRQRPLATQNSKLGSERETDHRLCWWGSQCQRLVEMLSLGTMLRQIARPKWGARASMLLFEKSEGALRGAPRSIAAVTSQLTSTFKLHLRVPALLSSHTRDRVTRRDLQKLATNGFEASTSTTRGPCTRLRYFVDRRSRVDGFAHPERRWGQPPRFQTAMESPPPSPSSPSASIMVHPSPEQSFSHSEPSFEHSSRSSPPSSPFSQRGHRPRLNLEDWSGDSSMDSVRHPNPPSQGISSCDTSFEVILDSETPRWFLRGSTSYESSADANAERVSPTSTKASDVHSKNSPPSKLEQRPRASSVADMRLVGATSVAAPSEAELQSAKGLAAAASRRASHDGVSLGHRRPSILPTLEAIPDDRISEAVAGATLDPQASMFEPSTPRDSRVTRDDPTTNASIELIIEKGKNEFGDLTKAARYGLAQRGFSTIPSLHGPLSLPYARCPSGIDAYLFSMDKEEDPWTFAFDQDTSASRRSAFQNLNAGRHAPVPLPGNARYLQGSHSAHSRVGSRVVSAPAEVGLGYTQPSGQSELPHVSKIVSQHYEKDGTEGAPSSSVGISPGPALKRDSTEYELWRTPGDMRSGSSALDRLEAIIEPRKTEYLASSTPNYPPVEPRRDVYRTESTLDDVYGAQRQETRQRLDGEPALPDLYASPYESMGIMYPRFYLQQLGYQSVGAPWATINSIPSGMSWSSNQAPHGVPSPTAHLPPHLAPPSSTTPHFNSIYFSSQGGVVTLPPRGPADTFHLRLFQDPAIIAASYVSDPPPERDPRCCHCGYSTCDAAIHSSNPHTSSHDFSPHDTLSPYAHSRPVAAAAEYRRGSAESEFYGTTGYRLPTDSIRIPELDTKKELIMSRRPSVPLQVASMRSAALPERRNSAAPAIPQIGGPRSHSIARGNKLRVPSIVPGSTRPELDDSMLSSTHLGTDGTINAGANANLGNGPGLQASDLAPDPTRTSTEKHRKSRPYRAGRGRKRSKARSSPSEAA
ncbi:BZ3500_MvSof-1268-A1-R1_Chr9g10902 [Microbotryum saponariae]|uniref:BZ3500_MvSof-1268-A1-R1_Chr9g10902 protein n=1 Tax=Microbotryum saponariae TaxID=289078 RepID=A0A2X0L5S6_9BASI|nr:BZ3501_MvSof-1269-A2-R1_Chr9g10650 [Microbotryum saponariae]SDA00889.1 BZ3500_MvSof-1268-A1-R1_Chr9g10902 [Microbotryum saponariae]